MPLLNKLDVPPPQRVLPPGGPAEVFILRVTGEVVATYEEYTAKRNQYAAKQWADRYGVAGGSLTYEEALRVEEGVESKISAAVRGLGAPPGHRLGDARARSISMPRLARAPRPHAVFGAPGGGRGTADPPQHAP